MGRKAKPKLSLREMEDEVILKYMNHEPMTLEEAENQKANDKDGPAQARS